MKRLRFFAFLVALTIVFATFSGFASTENAKQEAEQEIEFETMQPFDLPDIVEQAEASANGYIGRVTAQENDLYTFVFQNEDGSNTMRVYSDPVKYVDEDGVVRDITTDLEALPDGGFRTADNDIVTTFSKQLSDGITLAYDDVEIRMLPAFPDTVGAMRFGSALTASSEDGKTVSYAYGNHTTLEYTLTYSGFKEDIVVSEYTGQTEYEFRIETGGLFLAERFGSFYLTDDEGTTRATIGDIIIFTADERNNAFGSLTAQTVTAGEEYVLTIHIDPAYLRDEATVYPIRIDPTIEVAYNNNGAGAIEDVTINSLQGSDGSSGSLFVGKRDIYGISRVLMRFPGLDIDSLPGRAQINSAQVEIRDIMCDDAPLTIACGIFTGNAWTEATASWTTVNPNSCILMTSNNVSYTNGMAQEISHRYAFDILSAINGWIGGYYDQNKGIVFFANPSVENGTASAYKTFASYNRSSYKPSLSIEYRTIVSVVGLTPPSIPYSNTRQLTANHAYKYVIAPLTDTYSVWTTGTTDTSIYVYEDASLRELLAFDFDSGHGNNATVTFDVVSGKNYYVIVQGASKSTTGVFTAKVYRGLPLSGSEEENNIALFNNDEYIGQTNCYSYALNSLLNPVTGTFYYQSELNPGGMSGNAIDRQDLINAETAKTNITDAVRADCEAWGGSLDDFYEVSAETIVPEGYYKVALLLAPGQDYHWIRQVSDLSGRWAHKSGPQNAKDFDADDEVIYVPHNSRFAAESNGQEMFVYTDFLGYFALKPPSAYEAASVLMLQNIVSADGFETYSLDATVTVASFLDFVIGETTQHNVYSSVGLPHDYVGSGFIRDVYETADGYYVLLTYQKNDSGEVVIESIEMNAIEELLLE